MLEILAYIFGFLFVVVLQVGAYEFAEYASAVERVEIRNEFVKENISYKQMQFQLIFVSALYTGLFVLCTIVNIGLCFVIFS